MIKTEMGWDLYRTFLEVARDGSLSGAARRLGLTQPTAGRHIDALERSLGVSLFLRSRRGLVPTAAANDLLPHAEAMAASHSALLRTASGDTGTTQGTVRITASDIISTEVLPDILRTVCDQNPGLVIELVPSNRMQNLLRRDSDIAVRMHPPDQEALVAKRIGATQIGLYAHRSYVERHGLPADLTDLTRHRLIGFDRDDTSFRSAGSSLGPITRESFRYRCDSDVAQLAALRAGIGIGGCQAAIAARSADLIAVLPKKICFDLGIWVAMHEKLASVRRVRLVFDALSAGLRDYLRIARR
jgi:DNA-binding transcriptional LysR family regulator